MNNMWLTLLKMWKYVLILTLANLLEASSSFSKIEHFDTGTTNVLYGSERIIKCEIHSSVPIQIHWYHTNEKSGRMNKIVASEKYSISENGTELRIMKMDFDMVGRYICVASHSKKVGIILKPPKITGTNEIRVIRGTNAVIECKIIGGLPRPKITWEYKDKYEQNFKPIPGSGDKLSLLSVTDQKGGSYKCVATNVAGEDDHITNLVIDFPPTISQSMEIYEIIEGKSLTLPCKAVGNPKPVIDWKRNGTAISSSEKYSIEDGALVIKNLNESDSTSYTCEAQNYVGSANAAFIVRVYTAPKISGLAEVKVIRGSNAVIECNIIKGAPAPNITWLYWDKVVYKNLEKSFGSKRLLLPNVEENNAGNYKCVAVNIAGTDEHITTLIIESPPTIVSESSIEYEGLEGDIAFRIPCDVIGNPRPLITWKLNGRLINPDSKYAIGDGALVIKNPVEMNTTSYTCEAKNDIGSATKTFKARVDKFISRSERSKYVYILWGKTTKLDCEGYNSSSQSVRWFIESEEVLTLNPYMEILKPTLSNDGNYTCRISDAHGYARTHTYVVDVGYPPKVPDNFQIDDWRGDVGDILAHCESDAKPEAQVQWKFNGKVLTNEDLTKIGDQFKWGNYTCTISNVHGTVTRNFHVKSSACFVSRKLDEIKNMPLMLTEEFTWPRWDYTNYDTIVEQGDSITLSCPYDSKGTRNTFINFPYLTELKTSCHKEYTFAVNDKFYKLTDFLCNNNIQASVVKEHTKCLTDTSQQLTVGYRAYEFVETYKVCFDHAKNMPLYTRTSLTKTDGKINGAHDWFTYPEIGNPRLKSTFTCQACCYNKTHLVNPRDFNFDAAKKTTFINYLNEVPYWRACENTAMQTTWEDISHMVRDQLINYDNIITWSGTHTFQQKHGLLIPRYLWKVLKFEEDIIALIHVNDPAPTDSDIKCNDISQTNDMLYWFSASNKYTYCCDLNEFVDAFGLHGIDFTE
ncbi:hemicentin-1 isoform X2 [Helicoverpa armigera]|uniref:hemicentin-1 isoform X2 n=1 Tax=Helicoverpa armigera TaxID=29058 RepID=UPI003083ECF1